MPKRLEASTMKMPETDVEQGQEKPTVNKNCDRISSLHDSILYHILSELPTKDVVQASVLSKTWKNLWLCLPYLYFEASDDERRSDWRCFINFVDRVLLYRDNNSRIISFRLRLSTHSYSHPQCNDRHINSWITAAGRAGVQVLDIYSQFRYAYSLSSLLLCNSLVMLKLEFEVGSEFPEFFCFPKLKSMYLYNVVVAANFSDQLLINIPNLETFLLCGCCKGAISYPFPRVASDITHKQLNSPKLDTFLFGKCSRVDDTQSKISPWAETAFIGLQTQTEITGFSVITRFITKLHNVRHLCLSHSCIKLLQSKRNMFDGRPKFYGLEHLELWLDTDEGHVEVMCHLLHSSPVLRSIVIRSLDFRPVVLKSIRFATLGMLGFCGEKAQIEFLKLLLDKKYVVIVKLDGCRDPVSLRRALSHLQQQHHQVEINKLRTNVYGCLHKQIGLKPKSCRYF